MLVYGHEPSGFMALTCILLTTNTLVGGVRRQSQYLLYRQTFGCIQLSGFNDMPLGNPSGFGPEALNGGTKADNLDITNLPH